MFWFSEDKSKKIKEDKYDELEKRVWNFFMDEIPRLRFEQREGQEDMALDICYSIKSKKHTIIEAGVGIGKSYAYIVPLLYYNMLFNKPVLIATSTIALQEQLIKDVKKICAYIKHKPEIILAKGMTHFACRKRTEEKYKNNPFLSNNEDMLYKYIQNGTIDKRFINIDNIDTLWNDVYIKTTDHNKCEYFKTCRFMKLRENMLQTKGVILCNQDLLTVHMQKLKKGQKGLLSDDIDIIVIDEAHNLEDKVRSSLIESYDKEYMKSIVKEARNSIKKIVIKKSLDTTVKEIWQDLNLLFYNLNTQIKNQLSKDTNSKINDLEKFFIDIDSINKYILNINKNIKIIYEKVQFYSDSNISEEIIDNLQNLNMFLEDMLDKGTNNLFWMEKGKKIDIFSCPKNIDKEINRLYFDRTKTTILTSATIADKNNVSEEKVYEYFIKSTGFNVEKGFLSPQKFSPFDYDKNAIIYYTENMPHPTYDRESFIKKGTEEIVKLLNITQGRALILFTAKNDLNEVYKILENKKLGYNLLRQQKSSSQEEILNKFKEDEESVLLATGTFWEGIDVPGKSLSHLIVFRLPFPVPDPIMEYKRSLADDFLMDVSVPYMIVKLRQGVGRLIRKHDDKGIVSIIDSRVGDSSHNRYKDIVFNSLPIKNKTNNINIISEFYNKL